MYQYLRSTAHSIISMTCCVGICSAAMQFGGNVYVQGAELQASDVKAAVETWVRHVTADRRENIRVVHLEPFPGGGRPRAYIAHFTPKGFALCGSDTLVLPVYLYSPENEYDAANVHYQLFLNEIVARTEHYEQQEIRQTEEYRAVKSELEAREHYWNDLIEGRIPNSQSPHERISSFPQLVELAVETRWGQGEPYNNSCPMGNGGRTFVGCVATAMSQVARYWRWPDVGEGTHGYVWDGDDSCDGGSVPGTSLSADYTDRFLWDDMPVECDPNCSPGEEDALASLNYRVAVGVEMDFGACVSLSSIASGQSLFSDHLKYDSDVDYYDWGYPGDVTNEILWLRPVVMGGFDPNDNGHAWVVHGYNRGTDPDRQFLINLGWGGGSDWYTLDGTDLGFPNDQAILIRIAPRGVVRFVEAHDPNSILPPPNSGDGSPSQAYSWINWALTDAPNGTTLVFKAGSVIVSKEPVLRIDRELVLAGAGVRIEGQ